VSEPKKKLTSVYAGEIDRSQTRIPTCHTVGQLIEQLSKLPANLPIERKRGVKPVWFNIGRADRDPEMLGMEDPEDWHDD
jgi:hypothetical protein